MYGTHTICMKYVDIDVQHAYHVYAYLKYVVSDHADEESTLKQVINEELAIAFLTQPEMRYSNDKEAWYDHRGPIFFGFKVERWFQYLQKSPTLFSSCFLPNRISLSPFLFDHDPTDFNHSTSKVRFWTRKVLSLWMHALAERMPERAGNSTWWPFSKCTIRLCDVMVFDPISWMLSNFMDEMWT